MKAAFPTIFLLLFFCSSLWAQAPSRIGVSSPRVITVGDFPSPGPILYKEGMTVTDAVVASGGIIDLAIGKLYLIRCGKSEYIDRHTLTDRATARLLQPWDILYLNP